MTQKILITLCVVGALALLGLTLWSGNKTQPASLVTSNTAPAVATVRTEEGVQIIHILARGGYKPSLVEAKAGTPTRLEVETRGTYDCSAAFTIPSLSVKKMLPATGTTLVDTPAQGSGATIHALCAMGMYTLDLHFN